MQWALVIAVMLAGTVFGARYLLANAPARADRRVSDPDAAVDAEARLRMPTGVAASAVVTSLRQSGMSRGLVRHRCELRLFVSPPDGGDSRSCTIETDVDLSSLAYVLAGSTVDVLVDPGDPSRCLLLPGATRARATGCDHLPPVGCGGFPDVVLLHPEERVVTDPIATTAVVACVDIDSPGHGMLCNVTFGYWLDDLADDTRMHDDVTRVNGAGDAITGRAALVSERVTALDLMALPRGARVAVAVDPAEPNKVVVDLPAARAAHARRLATSGDLHRAVDALGIVGSVAMVSSLYTTKGSSGVRHRVRVGLQPLDRNGVAEGDPVTQQLLEAPPELAALALGSAVVLAAPDAEGRVGVDLEATERARAWCSDLRAARRDQTTG